MKQAQFSDAEIIAEWRSMLSAFETIIEKKPSPEKAKDSLMSLSEAATLSARLTGHQKDGIVTRCRNYMNGSYGVNKTKTDYMNNQPKS